ncbi:Uncharacterised protein [Mycobacteroides abscessus subsp. abscessus]|nr:Uncharacterised protein [Mycobacteroides abscessus subsp. abscessus]
MLLSPWITGVGCQLRWVPGVAVGAGLAVTDGVNRLPPFGLSDFSVGVTADVVVVVVVVVDDGASGVFFSSPQPAVRPIIAMSAVPPAATVMRWTRRFERMMHAFPLAQRSTKPRAGFQTYSRYERTGQSAGAATLWVVRGLTLVGGWVFTHRIEQIFEYRECLVVREVFLWRL